MKTIRVGIVDTTFARADLGALAAAEIESHFDNATIVRHTVPGMKDLPVACKILLDGGCDICIALAMPGGAKKDQVCAHEAAQGLMLAQLMTNKHIVEVFVHEDESEDPEELYRICENRARDHARNAVYLAAKPELFRRWAGQGVRQGSENRGSLLEDR